MTRFPCIAVVGALLVMAASAHAQQAQGPKVTRQADRPRYRLIHSQMPALPGYYLLRMEHVQKELELTTDQIEKLEALGKQYHEQMRADQGVWKDWRKMTPEQRTAKSAELREKYKQRAAELRKNIEKVLSVQQIAAIKEINFRSTGPSALANPRTLEKLQVSDEQREKLKEIRQRMLDQYRQLQKKAFEESLQVLTKEQREQLKERIQSRGY